MNKREAEEVVKRNNLYQPIKLHHAHGFLEAVEKFGPVVEALKSIMELDYVDTKIVATQALMIADDALLAYKREVLGEESEKGAE